MIRLLLVLLAIAGASNAEARRLPPVNGCAGAPGFDAFRTELIQAVLHRDVAFVRAMVAEDIDAGPGMEPGRARFEAWALVQPETSRLWVELESMLKLGCARDAAGRVWVPGLSLGRTVEELAVGADGSRQVLILGESVPVRALPNETSAVVATLNWDVVTAAPRRPGYDDWWVVQLPDGGRGYLTGANNIRFLSDYRAVFEQRQGQWRMILFAHGY
jgi:hypothetical protein